MSIGLSIVTVRRQLLKCVRPPSADRQHNKTTRQHQDKQLLKYLHMPSRGNFEVVTGAPLATARSNTPARTDSGADGMATVTSTATEAGTAAALEEVQSQETCSPDGNQTAMADLRQIWEWNAAVPLAVHRCVHELFLQRAEAQPTAPAVCAWDGNLSYFELDNLASGLASRLVALGVAPGTFVPACFEKSMWTVVAILGILKAGAAFVLLDPTVPELRLRAIVSQLRPSVIVSSRTNQVLSSQLVDRVVVLGSRLDREHYGKPPHHRPSTTPKPSSPMYIAFTSGSTGAPKGAIITHSNLASALFHQEKSLHITPESRVYDFSSYSFDVCVCNIFATLTAGGCLCVPNELDRQDPGRLAESIALLRANTIDLTPSVSRLLQPEQVGGIQQIIFGGEALRIEHVMPWWGKVRIVSLYGPCECTPNSTVNSRPGSPEEATHMGKGVGLNTWIVDADDHDSLVQRIGAVGELLLEGPLIGCGYLNEPEKTAAAFIEDPAWLVQGGPSEQPGRRGRLYKTGDLVRYSKDGSLSFVGRKDEQVKIRGQRLELGEIEHVLRGHSRVKDAVAVLKHENQQEPWIAGFVTIRDGWHEPVGAVSGEAEEDQQVVVWEQQFDLDYLDLENIQLESIGRDFMGWTSMFDGCAIGEDEMNEWLDDTLDSIRSSTTPRHVLEVGTGSGMILFNLIEELASYTGLEPSSRAVDFITRTVASMLPANLADKVSMKKGTAADVGHVVAQDRAPDVVVLNSVIQYFPNASYLLRVIRELVELQGVNTVFFGDVRSLAMYDEFLAARALYVAGPHPDKAELRGIMDSMRQAEAELLVDPAFFTGLPTQVPNIEHVEILPKRMRATNELSAYRYEAVIHVANHDDVCRSARELGSRVQWIDFQEHSLTQQSLLELLRRNLSTPCTVVAISNIPNKRTVGMSHVLAALDDERVDETTEWLSSAYENAGKRPSMSAAELVKLARQVGSRVQLSWARQSSQRGGIDAIFHTDLPSDDGTRVLFKFPGDHSGRTRDTLCNEPHTVQRRPKHRHTEVQNELFEILQAHLPFHMIPRFITVLDDMPLNGNGKVDRRTLAKITPSQTTTRRVPGPVQEVEMSGPEEQIRNMWGKVLEIDPASITPDDSFFKLGGDSMAAMKLVGLARERSLQLTVAHVFRHPRLLDFAHAVLRG